MSAAEQHHKNHLWDALEESNHAKSVWQRLEEGRRAKASRGGYAGYGSPPFGEQAIAGDLVEHPEEQQVIELIRRHHKSGKSLQQIADWLNQNHYVTKRGQQWRRISVKRVLDRLYGRTQRMSGINEAFADLREDDSDKEERR